MLQPANVATPNTAGSGFVVHPKVAEPGGGVMVNVTELESVVTGFPAASSTVTCGCVANATPLVASLGSDVNASCAGAPAMIEKVLLCADVKVPSVAVNV